MLKSNHYLKNLKDILGDRPIGFICHGHSLSILEENIDKFKGIDICWGSLNNYVIAQDILDKADLKLEFICASSMTYKNSDLVNKFNGLVIRELPAVGNTLHSFLNQLIDEGFYTEVYLFGANGFSHDGIAYYKGSSDIQGIKDQSRVGTHVIDCNHLNEKFPDYHGLVDIYNVCDESNYKVFDKIGIDKCISLLLYPH